MKYLGAFIRKPGVISTTVQPTEPTSYPKSILEHSEALIIFVKK